MPTVPYNPIPEAPQNVPAPYRTDAGATPQAFGYGFGESLQRFGAAGEALGNVLSKNALEMQDLNNRAATDKADTQFMTEAGAEHAKFNAMEGGERAAYFPTYMKNLKDIREKIRDSLPNPMVQKMYDSQTLRTLGQTIFNGAGAAATAAHEDAIKSNQARQAATVAWTAAQDDPAAVDEGKEKLRRLSIEHSRLTGVSDPEAVAGKADIASSVIDKAYIENLMPKDLEKAKEEFEKRKGHMSGPDQEHVQNMLNNHETSIGATANADDVVKKHTDPSTGQLDPKVTYQQLVNETRQLAQQRAPGMKSVEQASVARVETMYKEKVYGDAQTKNTNMNVIYGLINNNGARSTADLMRFDEGRAAVAGLPEKDRSNLDKTINTVVAAKEKAYNDEAMKMFAGMRLNDNGQFVQLDPFDEKYGLNDHNITTILNQQRQDLQKRGPTDDPRAWTALRTLQGSMGATLDKLGVSRGQPGYDRDKANLFMGSLTSAIQAWTDDHNGRPPSQKDITDIIGPDLIKTTLVPRGAVGQFFGLAPTQERAFEKKFEDDPNFKADAYRRENPDKDDDEIQRDYNRVRWLKFYEKKTSAGAPGEKVGERWPTTSPTGYPGPPAPPTSR